MNLQKVHRIFKCSRDIFKDMQQIQTDKKMSSPNFRWERRWKLGLSRQVRRVVADDSCDDAVAAALSCYEAAHQQSLRF